MHSKMLAILLLSMTSLSASATAQDSKADQGVASDTRIVVSQGGADVRLIDVDAAANTIPESARAAAFADPRAVERVLRGLLVDKQMVNEAHRLKLQDDPVIAAEMAAAANKVLVAARIEALKQQFKQNMPDQAELAKERYMANPSDFDVPLVMDVKHILIDTKKHSDAEAKALADKLYAELRKDPQAFDDDVEKYSDDGSKARNHGLIPDATSKKYVVEFSKAAAKLTKVGEISAPVKTQFGYHLLKVVKITPAHKRSFAEVKDKLVQQLESDYVVTRVQDHIDGLRSRTLEPNMELVKSLTTRYATPPKSVTGE